MCDSARATALMRIVRDRRVEVNGGTRVCRQQSHLSGRAAAWVGSSGRLRAVLGGSSMHVQPSCDKFDDGCCRRFPCQAWSSIIIPASGAPSSDCCRHDSPCQLLMSISRLKPHTIRQSSCSLAVSVVICTAKSL
jgi:hypothetical protein